MAVETMNFANHLYSVAIILVRNSGSAFDSTALEYISAGFGSHALDKSVLSGTSTALWLEGSFGHLGSPFFSVLPII